MGLCSSGPFEYSRVAVKPVDGVKPVPNLFFGHVFWGEIRRGGSANKKTDCNLVDTWCACYGNCTVFLFDWEMVSLVLWNVLEPVLCVHSALYVFDDKTFTDAE